MSIVQKKKSHSGNKWSWRDCHANKGSTRQLDHIDSCNLSVDLSWKMSNTQETILTDVNHLISSIPMSSSTLFFFLMYQRKVSSRITIACQKKMEYIRNKTLVMKIWPNVPISLNHSVSIYHTISGHTRTPIYQRDGTCNKGGDWGYFLKAPEKLCQSPVFWLSQQKSYLDIHSFRYLHLPGMLCRA